ncbi:ABC transporter ATP-binding protein [Wenzhouxiangella sp. AB-CW3]|uniref:ABC transporter ATP-binding protein n=1 Tax=Wenzhouxiangella sp. AB-CW3 TaxID=2771012 RepID=UPI00168B0621|nr:ABC transporter ATP-binding protein [Wenzhouxiangella sp. AB-CW3]QOC21507.1 ABC transporter ATP-binding protein [Wenzhouxiangella sp. AB-CW3]
MILAVDDIQLGYTEELVIQGLSFSLDAGEIGCLLGASGCGKTTALRAIAGFEPLRAGEIRIDGRIASTPDYRMAPEKRSVGMVFQDHALFPHLRVAENVGFGLRKLTRDQKKHCIEQLLELTGLEGLGHRYPHELSGGQQQRVALARALAPEPSVLLMDEPFSNLDTRLRRRMGEEIRGILKARGTATLIVTHDQQEAFALADKVGLLKDGRMLQWDSPYQLYHEPSSHYVAAFTGRGSYLNARVDGTTLVHALGRSPLPEKRPIGDELALLIRPDDIRPDHQGRKAEVLDRQFQGAQILYRLKLESGEEIAALFPSHDDYTRGDRVGVALDAQHLVLFPTTQAESFINPPSNSAN